MSTEFRQRKPAEYGRILWRRKWMILLPAVSVFFAVAAVVWRLPNVYQSTTLLTVRPSSLTGGIIPKLSEDDLTIRINNIAQEVLSRSSLEPMIINYNLYAAERRRGEPMEMLVELMKKRDIQINLNQSRNDITNGFQLSYKGPDPLVVQRVTSDLASKYTNAQEKVVSESANQTKEFIDRQVAATKEELDAIDARRLEYLKSNLANLPSSTSALVQQLSGLYEQQKAYITEIGRMRDQMTMLTTQLAASEKNTQVAIEDVADNATDPKTTLAWADLSGQESHFESEIQAMLAAGLRPKNPDVLAKQKELEAVKKQKQRLLDDWKEKIAEKKARLEKRVDTGSMTYRSQLQFAQSEIARQEKLLAETRAGIADISARINRVPAAEVGLSALDREYQTKKGAYDDLLKKQQGASLSAEASKSAQGETIRVIDPASFPEKPIAPKRPMLMMLGLGLGLGLGLLFAAAFEVPRLLTIQTVEDARHYTSLPVLVSVPELLTPREERRRKVRRAALAFAGVVATVISAPVLALLLKLTHVFEILGA
ncbi:MAG TPA: GNVR domain-containing protein [Pyrinomonadaceae bacterium]|jgi:polysaccharide chain length determinant protein (PEP-CTERM system associated)